MTTNEAAIEVWRAARAAQGAEPTAERVQRIRGKLSDPSSFVVVLSRGREPVGMALAEPFRNADGFGSVEPGHGHVSMVFVRPEQQGFGVGTQLVQRIIDEAPWTSLSLWTRGHLTCAERLRSLGFRATSDHRRTALGDRSQRWVRAGA